MYIEFGVWEHSQFFSCQLIVIASLLYAVSAYIRTLPFWIVKGTSANLGNENFLLCRHHTDPLAFFGRMNWQLPQMREFNLLGRTLACLECHVSDSLPSFTAISMALV